MKKILLLVLFSSVTLSVFAQMSGDYNYSIVARGFTMMQMPKVFNEINADKFTNAYLNGLMFKFNDNQISYRLNGTYYNKSKKFYNNCESCQEAEGKLIDYSFKIGFEKNFNYSRIQPYFGFDLGYRSNKFSGNLENRNQLRAKSSAVAGQSIESTKTGFLASPVVGVKISPIAQLSFFAEGNLDFFYSFERQETISHDINNTRVVSSSQKAEFLLNPVSVGIQIYLGSNK